MLCCVVLLWETKYYYSENEGLSQSKLLTVQRSYSNWLETVLFSGWKVFDLLFKSCVLCARHTFSQVSRLAELNGKTDERSEWTERTRDEAHAIHTRDTDNFPYSMALHLVPTFHIRPNGILLPCRVCMQSKQKWERERSTLYYTNFRVLNVLYGMSCRVVVRAVCVYLVLLWRAAVSSIFTITKLRLLTPLNQLKLMSSNVVALVYVNSYSFNFPLLQPLSFHFSVIAGEHNGRENRVGKIFRAANNAFHFFSHKYSDFLGLHSMWWFFDQRCYLW